VACNIGNAAFNPPDATYSWAVIDY